MVFFYFFFLPIHRGMKTLFFVTVISLMALLSFAQVAGGLKAGFNASTFGGDMEERSDLRLRPGFHFGASVNIPINAKLSVQPELLFSMVGAKWEEGYELENSDLVKLEIVENLTYICMPLSMIYSFGRFNIHGGPQVSLLLAASDDVTMLRVTGGNTIITAGLARDAGNLKKVDAGLNFGPGVDFGNFGISARYYLGLTNLMADDEANDNARVTNRGFQVSLMYKFSDQ